MKRTNSHAVPAYAIGITIVAVALCVVFRFLPESLRVWWHVTPLGALAVYCGARLRGVTAWAVPLGTLLFTDLVFYFMNQWPLSPMVYAALGIYVALGRVFLAKESRRYLAVPVALAASVAFFLVTNFEAWMEQSLPYGYTFAGLLNCYKMGIPFYRGTLVGDVAFSVAFFAADLVLAKRYAEKEESAAMGETV